MGIIELGACGVSIFFVMSGFLMWYSYQDRMIETSVSGCIRFSIQKIKKLYILHIITLALALPYEIKEILYSFSIKSGMLLVGKIILNALLLQSWIPSEELFFSLNGVSWFLSDCLFMYACFPVLLVILKKLATKKALVVATTVYAFQFIVAMLVNKMIPTYTFWIVYILPIFRLGDFFIGCCIGKFFVHIREKGSIGNRRRITIFEGITLVIFVMVQLFYIYHYKDVNYTWITTTLIYTPLSVCIVLLFALAKGYISRLLSCSMFVVLGNISAYTFLIHQIVIRYSLSISHKLTDHGLDGLVIFL